MGGLGKMFVEICNGRNIERGIQMFSRGAKALNQTGRKVLSTTTISSSASSAARPVGSAHTLQMRSWPVTDSVISTAKLTFDDVYKVVKMGNGRIKLIPKMHQVNGKNVLPLEMPEYLYHITSESNYNLMRSSHMIKVSANEQLPGVFLLDKENFLTRYQCVGKNKRNLCKSLITHANNTSNGSSNLIVIRIPTENLCKNGKFRVRTQEDFFYYQDKVIELQKGLKQKFSLRQLYDDGNRAQFVKLVLDNKLMTKAELDQFMSEMEQKIHRGYQISQLSSLEKNCAVEYIFNHNVNPDTIKGIKCKKFSVNDCINPTTGEVNIEYLKRLFS